MLVDKVCSVPEVELSGVTSPRTWRNAISRLGENARVSVSILRCVEDLRMPLPFVMSKTKINRSECLEDGDFLGNLNAVGE